MDMIWVAVLIVVLALGMVVGLYHLWVSYVQGMQERVLSAEAAEKLALERAEWYQARADETQQDYIRQGNRFARERDRLMQQIQGLSERVATLRRITDDDAPAIGGDETFHPQEPEREPYSQEIVDFLNKVDHPDARELIEDQIEEYRETGMHDAQIFELISEGRHL